METSRFEELFHLACYVTAVVLSVITFGTAVHAHHAAVRTHVALHALHSRLAGAQARHLLAVVPH